MTPSHLARRTVVTALASLPLALAAGPAAFAAPRQPARTLYLAGDSTASQKYADAAPETGWGMALPFFVHEGLTVANHAVNGRSSKSFIDEGRLTAILDAIAPDDILLAQFGHNDEKADDPTRYTEPWTTYQDHLRQYVAGARDRGALPVLATPVERRRFDSDGNAQPSHGEYPAAMIALAAEEGVPLLDTQALSLALWQQLGEEESKQYFNWSGGTEDNTHFSPVGAIAVARIAAGELLARGVLGEDEVRRLDEDVPAEWITWPSA